MHSGEEKIILDFEKVDILTPNWADEFITKLIERQGKEKVEFQKKGNPSVKETLNLLFP